MSVRPRTVFVTGCSSGIGRATALLFARRGYLVTATGRNLQLLRELEEIAARENLPMITVTCDVTDDASVASALVAARNKWGRIEVLINNAGYGLMGPVEGVPLEDARIQLETNTLGPVRLIQQIAPDMRASGWGRIVNVSSICGRIVIPYVAWYAASKFALEALNDCLRLELRQFGIRTISIMPGPVQTEFRSNVLLRGEDAIDGLYRPFVVPAAPRKTERRPFAISPEQVAKTIFDAVRASNPRARYYLTIPGRLGAVLYRLLPDSLMDFTLRKYYGIDREERRLNREAAA